MTLKEYFAGDRFASDAGMEITLLEAGHAIVEMTIEDRHLNGAGFCQGGVFFTLADLAFACATNSHGIPTVTVSANITILRAATKGMKLRAEAHEIFNHKSLPYAEVRVSDDAGNILAILTASGYRKRNATLDVEDSY